MVETKDELRGSYGEKRKRQLVWSEVKKTVRFCGLQFDTAGSSSFFSAKGA